MNKDKITGEWLNEDIEYVFDEYGNITIHWIKDSMTKTGSWSIENDEITINYGVDLLQTWEGKINYVNDKELSITDLSNQIGTVDLYYKKEFISSQLLNQNLPTPEKKSFKDKLTETVWGVIGIAFMAVFFGGIGYLIYKGFEYESHEYIYFNIGIMLFVLSAIPLIFTLYKGSDHDALFLKGFLTFYASFIVVPLLYFVLVVFFAIITLWYYLLAIGVIIALIVFFLNKEEKWLNKSIIILLSLASIYFLYDAKSILKIKFEVYFDDRKIGVSDDE